MSIIDFLYIGHERQNYIPLFSTKIQTQFFQKIFSTIFSQNVSIFYAICSVFPRN